MNKKEILLEVNGVSKYFELPNNKVLKAVDNVSLKIEKGEIVGIVGESGCGKSTFGKLISRTYKPTKGKIYYKGKLKNLPNDPYMKNQEMLNTKEVKEYCKNVQVVFQDPYSSLNPRQTAGDAIGRGLKVHGLYKGKVKQRVAELLNIVGLSEDARDRFPHEFSGGQRQRICIARALAIEPELLICDEPISALDVSIQSQIINLLKNLKETLELTMIFISHDLSVVKYICDKVVVMYLGTVMEMADSNEIYNNPLHYYTKALLSAVPFADPCIEKNRQRILLTGDIPSPVDAPSGCTFSSRCPDCDDICIKERPELKMVEDGHYVACHKVLEDRRDNNE